MLLSELLLGTGIECPCDIEITGLCEDSRAVSCGDLYIAIRGGRYDGHRSVGEAISRGARAVLLCCGCGISPTDMSVPCLFTPDTRKILPYLYASYFGHPEKNLTLIGVTGTNGKTSVSSIIYSCLNFLGRPCGLIGTLGAYLPNGERLEIRSSDPTANMTTPSPRELFAMLRRFCDCGVATAVMEVSSHALSQHRVDPLCFEIAIFTNLSEEHLDYHESMESYFAEKMKLFDISRRAIVNIDDLYGRALLSELRIPYITTACEGNSSTRGNADLFACAQRVWLDHIEYKISSRSLRLRVSASIGGGFAVPNSLQAIGALHLMGYSGTQIRSAISHIPQIRGRLERVELPQDAGYSVYIDYAHTPDALESLLRTVHLCCDTHDRGRIILLFGCGGERDRYKRRQMGRIGSKMADLLIITSDNPRGEDRDEIIRDILLGVDKESRYVTIPDRRVAIEYAVMQARQGDRILLCGKGHENYEIDAQGRKPFCEKEIVIKADMRRRGKK